MRPEVDVVDAKGDYWHLMFLAIQFNKRDGMMYALWHVIEGPGFLRENGAQYDFIPVPVFQEFWI